MARIETFTFRVDDAERQMIAGLSKRLQRSQSDSVRWLIREAYGQLDTAVDQEATNENEFQAANGRAHGVNHEAQ